MIIKNLVILLFTISAVFGSSILLAADYKIDTKNAHAFIQFRVQHLGYSWLYGRFNEFDGMFSYDEKYPEKTTIKVNIKTASVDSNHAERDKHLRSDDFLNVKKYPNATFVSTGYKQINKKRGILTGDLTLNGVTESIGIMIDKIGGGKDPWGGYRVGFEGNTKFAMADFNITKNLGPKSKAVELILSIEGIRQ